MLRETILTADVFYQGWNEGGYSRCEFQSETNDPQGTIRRWLFKIPIQLRKTNKFLKTFLYEGPTTPFVKGSKEEIDAGESEASAPAAIASLETAALDESFAEVVSASFGGNVFLYCLLLTRFFVLFRLQDEPPKGQRLFGISIVFCGSAKTLGGTMADMKVRQFRCSSLMQKSNLAHVHFIASY